MYVTGPRSFLRCFLDYHYIFRKLQLLSAKIYDQVKVTKKKVTITKEIQKQVKISHSWPSVIIKVPRKKEHWKKTVGLDYIPAHISLISSISLLPYVILCQWQVMWLSHVTFVLIFFIISFLSCDVSVLSYTGFISPTYCCTVSSCDVCEWSCDMAMWPLWTCIISDLVYML